MMGAVQLDGDQGQNMVFCPNDVMSAPWVGRNVWCVLPLRRMRDGRMSVSDSKRLVQTLLSAFLTSTSGSECSMRVLFLVATEFIEAMVIQPPPGGIAKVIAKTSSVTLTSLTGREIVAQSNGQFPTSYSLLLLCNEASLCGDPWQPDRLSSDLTRWRFDAVDLPSAHPRALQRSMVFSADRGQTAESNHPVVSLLTFFDCSVPQKCIELPNLVNTLAQAQRLHDSREALRQTHLDADEIMHKSARKHIQSSPHVPGHSLTVLDEIRMYDRVAGMCGSVPFAMFPLLQALFPDSSEAAIQRTINQFRSLVMAAMKDIFFHWKKFTDVVYSKEKTL